MNADDLATALTNGARRAGSSCRSPRSCRSSGRSPWCCTSPGRTSIRFLQSLTLRFGGDVWWLSYVLFRDALLVITLGLSMVFLMPNLYFEGRPADHRAARRCVVLFWALVVKLLRDSDDDSGRLPARSASCS